MRRTRRRPRGVRAGQSSTRVDLPRPWPDSARSKASTSSSHSPALSSCLTLQVRARYGQADDRRKTRTPALVGNHVSTISLTKWPIVFSSTAARWVSGSQVNAVSMACSSSACKTTLSSGLIGCGAVSQVFSLQQGMNTEHRALAGVFLQAGIGDGLNQQRNAVAQQVVFARLTKQVANAILHNVLSCCPIAEERFRIYHGTRPASQNPGVEAWVRSG